MAVCALCRKEADLVVSHIVPRFVSKRLKDDSPKPFLRSTKDPNRRVQDVQKQPLLCLGCEDRFNRLEDPFSRDIFTPTMNGEEIDALIVTEEHRGFCASLAWRELAVTLPRKGSDDVADYDAADWEAVERREAELRAYLLGEAPHPADLEHHLFCSRSTAETEQPGMNALFNLTAGIWVCGDSEAPDRLYGLAFLNGLIVISHVRSTPQMHDEWSSGATLIAPGATWRNHHQEIHDGYFGRMLKGMAQLTQEEMAAMSPAQKKAVEEAFASADIEKWIASPHGQAVLQDHFNREKFRKD